MRAGKLDRRLKVYELRDAGVNALNEPIKDWIETGEFWAQQRPQRGSERFAAAQIAGTAVVTFHTRYLPWLTTKHRVEVEGVSYELIAPPRELGRRVGSEIDCIARKDD